MMDKAIFLILAAISIQLWIIKGQIRDILNELKRR